MKVTALVFLNERLIRLLSNQRLIRLALPRGHLFFNMLMTYFCAEPQSPSSTG
jgi:hypothetical protein